MCKLYASTDPELYACDTRSIRISGFVTSVRLEKEFWNILDEIAHGEGITTPQFISKLYDEVMQQKGEVKNLASLLRVACTVYLTQRLPAMASRRIASATGLAS